MRYTVTDDATNKAGAHLRMVQRYLDMLDKLELYEAFPTTLEWVISVDHAVYNLEIENIDQWKITRVR
jgi:hypothetical protein